MTNSDFQSNRAIGGSGGTGLSGGGNANFVTPIFANNGSQGSQGVELVFDPSGAARLNDLTPSEEEERNYFWLNENNPTFLTAKPAPKEG